MMKFLLKSFILIALCQSLSQASEKRLRGNDDSSEDEPPSKIRKVENIKNPEVSEEKLEVRGISENWFNKLLCEDSYPFLCRDFFSGLPSEVAKKITTELHCKDQFIFSNISKTF